MKKLSHLQINSYRTDDWKSYRYTLSKSIFHPKNILFPKLKLPTLKDEIERLAAVELNASEKTLPGNSLFSKKDDMRYRIIKAYIFLRNKFGSLVKAEHTF